MKQCYTCREWKNESEFYKCKQNKDGLNGNCKICMRSKYRVYYSGNSDRYVNYSRKYYYNNINSKKKYYKSHHESLKIRVIEKYGGICKCCGESTKEFLTIDHINKDGANKRRNGMKGSKFYRWLDKNPIQEDLRILCYNCNCSYGFYGYCPHNKR